jgi:GntR family transcriptional regulator
VANVIDPTSDRAVYKQIADDLREAVRRGELAPGSQLPSEQELIERHGVARGTIRQAINLLKSEGLVETEHGRGSFVRARLPVRRLGHDRFLRRHRDSGKAAFIAEQEGEGRTPTVEVLELGRRKASAEVAGWLGIEPGAAVLIRRRRYRADGQPMELATSWIPWNLARGTAMTRADTGPGGVYARLEETGHELERFHEEIVARMPTEAEVQALQLPGGVPVMRLVRVAYDKSGIAVEACDTVLAADRYVLDYELPAR